VIRKPDRNIFQYENRAVPAAVKFRELEGDMIAIRTLGGAVFAYLVFATDLVHLQAQGVATSRISGSVTDQSNRVLVGAAIEATDLSTGSGRSAITDSEGRYAIADLPIGSYDVVASSANFAPMLRRAVTLTIGADLVIDFTLKVGQAGASVMVTSELSRVETQTATVSTLISSDQLHNLPLNGRNFEQLISLAPGVTVVPASLSATTNGIPTDPIYGSQDNYSISGSRPVGEAFLLDNTDIGDFFNHATGSGVSGTTLGVEAIAEFQVLTNTYSARFGGTGAAVNIASRSGTNNFHGSAYEFIRNNVLDARGYFDVNSEGEPTSPPAYRRNQFGGTLGGPLRKDRTFAFVNYEGLRSSLGQTGIAYVPEPYVLQGQVCNVNPQVASPGATTCPSGDLVQVVPDVPAIQAAILALYPQPAASALDLGSYAPYPVAASLVTEQNYFLGRLDEQISSSDSVFGRYLIDNVNQTNPFAGSLIPLWPDLEVTRNQYFTTEERHLFGATRVNLLRASFVRTNANGHTTNEVPALALYPSPGRQNMGVTPGGGLSSLGGNGADPFRVLQNKISVGDDFLWNWRGHSFTAGGSITRVQSVISDGNFEGGGFYFFTLPNFLHGLADIYFGASPPAPGFNNTRGFRQIDIFPYFQDDWRLLPKLTLNLGLRWDFATNAVGSGAPLEAVIHPLTDSTYTVTRHALGQNPNWANFDPRVGIAYDPFADHRTSIRAGFGIFHEQLEARTYGLGYDSSPPSGFIQVEPPAGGIPFPMIPNAPASESLGVSYRGTTRAPYVIQYNFTLQREIVANMVASLGYVGSRGVHLFSLVNENLPIPCSEGTRPLPSWCPPAPSGTPGLAANPFTGLLSNPNFGPLADAAPTSASRYSSLQAALNRQFGRVFQIQASYAWSKCVDNGSATNSQEASYGVADPYDQSLDRGHCTFNRTQDLVANGLYSLPFARNRVVSGWRLAGLLTGATGFPVNVLDGFDQSLGGGSPARPDYSGAAGCHPYRILNKPIAGPAIQYFDPACYTLSAMGTVGNVGRNSIYGPGLLTVDFSVMKHTRIREKLDSEFRAEFFNLFDRSNFSQPNPRVFTGPTAGQITSLAAPARQIQFALKFLY